MLLACWRELVLSRLGAGFRREPHQLFAGFGGCPHRNRKQNPARCAIENDVAALGIDTRHAPGSSRSANRRGIKLNRTGMVAVHMLDDVGLGFEEALGFFGLHEEITRGEIEDAPEAADIMCALDLKPPKGKIGEVRIKRRLWMPREESPPYGFFGVLAGAAPHSDSCALQRIGESSRL